MEAGDVAVHQLHDQSEMTSNGQYAAFASLMKDRGLKLQQAGSSSSSRKAPHLSRKGGKCEFADIRSF